ncbi:MAG: DNA translocase FtsK 4TM domain-containing protein [Methylococcales bacterium]
MSAVMEEKTFRGLREIAILVFFAVAVFFLISLVTFSNEDAGWTHSGTGQKVVNACGLSGAWLADFTLSFFGLCGYLFPIIICWHGYLLYARIRQKQQKITTVLQWLGSIATIVASAALLYLYLLRVGIELPLGTGGILGQETGDAVLVLFGNSGATLFLIVLLLSGITLATDLSWIGFIDLIGGYTVAAFQFLGFMSTEDPKEPIKNSIQSFDSLVEKSVTKKKTPVKVERSVGQNTAPIEKSIPFYKPQKHAASNYSHMGEGVLPSLELLDQRDTRVIGYSQADLEEMSRLVEDILADFNVSVVVVDFHPGPVITRFELQPAAGVKVSRICGLSKDLARALSVTSVRIVEIIPGKSVVGLEIPNREREMVTLRELLVSAPFENAKSLLTLAMGKDIAGVPLVADLGKMPHALVAGTTGSGKSVAINTMILSLLFKATPQEVRLIMIDPKMLELSVYEGIPHLLTPVVTDMKEASNALRWAVAEMERRYKLMSKMGVRNLAGFNHLIDEATARGETIRDPIFQLLNPLEEGESFPVLTKLPSIVIVIDELADMMMIVGKKVEELIARLAQKARAAGIHLILATQRPSVDVLTGLIKANVPTRISFQVSSRIDSRTILDQGGAEALLGNGDMLFLPSGTSIPIRAHGAFVDDHEVHRVVEFLKQTAPPDYLEEITRESSDSSDGFNMSGESSNNSENDALYDEAVMFVTESRKASISSVQRRFKVGYNRAATMIEAMEAAGVVSAAESNGSRVVLAPPPPSRD